MARYSDAVQFMLDRDTQLITQLNQQLAESSRKLDSERARTRTLEIRCRDLEASLAALMCWGLVPFADGELDPERRAAFERHLVGCKACQDGLEGLMQVEVLMTACAPVGSPRHG